MGGGEAFYEHGLHAVADGELDVLAGDLGEVVHERQGDLAEAVAAWGEGGDLQQAQADAVAARGVAFQGAPAHQPGGQPQGGAGGHVGAAAQFAQGERAVVGVERGQQRQRPVDDRFAVCRAAAADADRRWLVGLLGRGFSIGWHHR